MDGGSQWPQTPLLLKGKKRLKFRALKDLPEGAKVVNWHGNVADIVSSKRTIDGKFVMSGCSDSGIKLGEYSVEPFHPYLINKRLWSEIMNKHAVSYARLNSGSKGGSIVAVNTEKVEAEIKKHKSWLAGWQKDLKVLTAKLKKAKNEAQKKKLNAELKEAEGSIKWNEKKISQLSAKLKGGSRKNAKPAKAAKASKGFSVMLSIG